MIRWKKRLFRLFRSAFFLRWSSPSPSSVLLLPPPPLPFAGVLFFSLKCKTGALLFGKGDFARAVLVPYSTKLAWQVGKVIRVGCETGLLLKRNIECEAGALLFHWNARRRLCFLEPVFLLGQGHYFTRFSWQVGMVFRVGCFYRAILNAKQRFVYFSLECKAGVVLFLWSSKRALCFLEKVILLGQ